jgi:hypothetical protein
MWRIYNAQWVASSRLDSVKKTEMRMKGVSYLTLIASVSALTRTFLLPSRCNHRRRCGPRRRWGRRGWPRYRRRGEERTSPETGTTRRHRRRRGIELRVWGAGRSPATRI